jgi:hypothetical protein
MDSNQPTPRPKDCPDCGTPFPDAATSCWLCGWKFGDPVGIRPKQEGPSSLIPSASPNRGDLKWTFSLSTLFLWTALMAVVMGVVRIAPGLGIALGILSIPAALHSTAIAAKRERRPGHALTVPEKIEAFFMSFALVVLFACGSALAAFGAFFVTCTAWMTSGRRFQTDFFYLPPIAAGVFFVGFLAYFLVRNVRRTKD